MLFYFLLFELSLAESPIVFTSLGIAKGFYSVRNSTSPQTEVFLNIPYALPPVGELRFEKPVPVSSFGNLDATNWGSSCIQSTDIPGVIESENCLTLGIVKPSKKPPPDGFPVLFWIHGGGFITSSPSVQGYERFLPYAEDDIIVVFPQYRVGVFGFLSDGSSKLKGNLGLWDLTLALKFVKKHISAFGGNGEEISLWGYSAGGVAAGLLTLSPHSRDLVARSIEMSGNAWPKWVEGRHVEVHSRNFMQKLGCLDISCLKLKPLSEIKESLRSFNPVVFGFEFTKFSPRVDGDFLPATPDSLAEEAPPKPIMCGFGDKDISGLTAMGAGRHLHDLGDPKILSVMNKDQFLQKVQELIDLDSIKTIDKSSIDIFNFYIKNRGGSLHNMYIEFVGDVINNIPLVRSIQKRVSTGCPVYLYSTDYQNNVIWKGFNVFEDVRGAVHGSEYPYMFGVYLMTFFELNEKDREIGELWTKSIINFAKFGRPLGNWEATSKGVQYFSIAEKQMKRNFGKEETEFWKSQS